MSQVTIKQLSELIGISTAEMLTVVATSKIDVVDVDTPLSEEEKEKLLAFLQDNPLQFSQDKKDVASEQQEEEVKSSVDKTKKIIIEKTSVSPTSNKKHSASKTVKKKNGSVVRSYQNVKVRSSAEVSSLSKNTFIKPTVAVIKEVVIDGNISVVDLAKRLSVKYSFLLKKISSLSIEVTPDGLDQDTATLVVEELGHKVKIVKSSIEKSLLNKQYTGKATIRPPVITVMGHVDHGKTSLLDYIRKAKVTTGEDGGITQHIGAYQVQLETGSITFLDTPGHAAFSAMRSRGSQITDIVVLVVAADDSVMPQTIESIEHAKAVGVPLIVAINKIDRDKSNIEKVKQDLSGHDVIAEDWGGEVPCIPVSAITGEGVDNLLEMILLQAELLELKAMVEGPAQGIVVESRLDKGRGVVITALITDGTLKCGDCFIAGDLSGKVRSIADYNGKQIKLATPGMPVELTGISSTPTLGDNILVVKNDKIAKEIIFTNKNQDKNLMSVVKSDINDMFAQITQDSGLQYLNLIIKADVTGSVEAIKQSLMHIGKNKIKVNFLAVGIGAITDTDVALAAAKKGSIIIGFNVRADNMVRNKVVKQGLEMRYYSVIYDVIEDIEKLMVGMLPKDSKEKIVGIAEVREVFSSQKFGQVAGCLVVEGSVYKNKKVRVLRNEVVVFEGELSSLRRFKDNVDKVLSGVECGIGVKGYNNILPKDKIENFEYIETAAQL